jgi:hypothetical protein
VTVWNLSPLVSVRYGLNGTQARWMWRVTCGPPSEGYELLPVRLRELDWGYLLPPVDPPAWSLGPMLVWSREGRRDRTAL